MILHIDDPLKRAKGIEEDTLPEDIVIRLSTMRSRLRVSFLQDRIVIEKEEYVGDSQIQVLPIISNKIEIK